VTGGTIKELLGGRGNPAVANNRKNWYTGGAGECELREDRQKIGPGGRNG